MTFIKIAGMLGGGTLGVLVVGFFAAHLLFPGSEWLFGLSILAAVGGIVGARFV